MKSKILAFFRPKMRAANIRLAALKSRVLLWLARHSTIFNKIYPNTSKRRFFIVKAKLINFYQTNVQPKLAAARDGLAVIKNAVKATLTAVRARLIHTKQRLTTWLKRHRRGLLMAGSLLVTLAIAVSLAFLWTRSPRLQAAVRSLAAFVVALLASLAAFLKVYGSRLWAFLTGVALDLHSHHRIPPFFSSTDDADEQGGRFYGVLGHLDRPQPELALRLGMYGQWLHNIPALALFEELGPLVEVYVDETDLPSWTNNRSGWLDRVLPWR